MSRLKYIIDINIFLPNSGGIVALHKLCHDLRSIGEEAYTLCAKTHPHLDAPHINSCGKKFTQDEIVIIYPEIVSGNPHNCKNVVRWALNTPGEPFYQNKKPSDLIFKYSDFFHLKDENESKGLLTTTFVDKDIFYNSNLKRSGSAFFVKKGGAHKSIHPATSIDLSKHEHNWQYMANTLRSVEYFYCYDNACFWVVLAALCGCIPIVVPDSDMLAEEWYQKFPHKQCGVAYGIDKIQHAKDTQERIWDNLEKFYKSQLSTVEKFVEVCNINFV